MATPLTKQSPIWRTIEVDTVSYNLKDIVHETKNHFVLRVKTGFEVYKIGITHSTRCARIGYLGEKGDSSL